MVNLLVAFAFVLCGTAIFVSFRVIESMNDEHYMGRADEIAAVMARSLDVKSAAKISDEVRDIYYSTNDHVQSDAWGSPEFESYVSHYAHLANTPEFKTLLAQQRSYQEVMDVDCLYTMFVDPVDKGVVYIVDAALEEPCPIGCIDPLYEFNYPVLKDPTIGFPAYITNTEEYGWLVTSAAPVMDDQGQVVCYACVDISMDAIKQRQSNYVWGLSIGLVSITIVLSILAGLLVRHFVTKPLNTLSAAATRYCAPGEKDRSTFEGLNIATHDEIQQLYESMIQMEHDIDGYINNLVRTRAELRNTRQEADLMNVLAHRDALTGIRNKLAFNQEMNRLDDELVAGQTRFGIAVVDMNDLKLINDNYGHDRGDESLRHLSSIICSVFVHSPVFRIGGDEFAVVLRDNDYDKIDELVDEFKAALAGQAGGADAQPWERVSAALGYALYDAAKDKDSNDVFRRADSQMYQHKTAMKGADAVR